MKEVYIVQYHSNSWGDQMSSDAILGVYSSRELAEQRANDYEQNQGVFDDDIISVFAYEIDKDELTLEETK